MKPTANRIRRLLAIRSLTELQEEVASKNAGKLLGITRPSVNKMLAMLSGKGLIGKEFYGSAKLTPLGRDRAARLEERKEALRLMFSCRFGLSMDESGLAATVLMSGLREESLDRLTGGGQE